jgi:hypothetical protein
MSIKTFEFGEKIGFRKKTVQNAHRVMPIQSGHKTIAGILYGPHVARGNKASSTD